MVMCFVPDCKHYSEKHGCTFFVFPKDPIEKKRWIKLIRREDRDPSPHSLVCACHFKDGNRKNGPTLFERNVKKVFDFEMVQQPKRKKRLAAYDEPGVPGPSQIQYAIPSEEEDIYQESDSSDRKPIDPSESEDVEVIEQHQPESMLLEAQVYFLSKENNELKEKNKHGIRMAFHQIEDDDHLICIYTGLPTKDIFMALYSLMANIELNYYYNFSVTIVPKIDQLLLTLMKLRLNLLFDDLAFRFKISKKTVSNIFKTWLYALHEVLFKTFMEEKMPTTEKNKLCMPNCFSSFTNCRVVIDCTEVASIAPKSMEKQRATYSSYKRRNTLKGLIGVAPNGVITYCSKLYPGSTSDKKIVQHCGILHQLAPGDLVLADKGFLINDLLPQGVELNIPPFLTTPQFTSEQVIVTRTIARARIHVERAIRRMKCFSIFSKMPQTLLTHSSVIFQVCAALTNLQFPLIKEVEDLYTT